MFNRQLKRILIIIAIGSILAFISYNAQSTTTCPIRHLGIAEEMKKYDETKDPKTCDMLNAKISQFNSDCKSDIEELDCG